MDGTLARSIVGNLINGGMKQGLKKIQIEQNFLDKLSNLKLSGLALFHSPKAVD